MLRPSAIYAKKLFKDKKISIVEIGVREGLNAIEMLNSFKTKMVYLVDNYGPYDDDPVCGFQSQEYQNVWYSNMFRNMKKYQSRVTLITQTSNLASLLFEDNSLDYVYIDANHLQAWVREDMNLWYPKVKKGGILAGHDFNSPYYYGVKAAVLEFLTEQKKELLHLTSKEDWAIKK